MLNQIEGPGCRHKDILVNGEPFILFSLFALQTQLISGCTMAGIQEIARCRVLHSTMPHTNVRPYTTKLHSQSRFRFRIAAPVLLMF